MKRPNQVLLKELKEKLHKEAFVPGPMMQQGVPSGPGGAPPPQGMPPSSPYQDPAAMQAAGGPGGAMPQQMAPQGGGGQPGGGSVLDQLAPMIDQRIQAMMMQQQGGAPGQPGAKGEAKVKPEQIMQEIQQLKQQATYTRKIMTALLEQNGKPMPYDVLDEDGNGVPDSQEQGGPGAMTPQTPPQSAQPQMQGASPQGAM
jgi:hypothetical protein